MGCQGRLRCHLEGRKHHSVAANPEDNAALFLSPVEVGGQKLNLDFDSGSSDL
jgi:hypothetical protein